ncbi:MAG: Osmosensitive channel histidine kinase kdpD [Myxococcaceae bacterium]|nr:Osmosensitive channel histidine kinase kdpD [Myxococcaceae bacterium]
MNDASVLLTQRAVWTSMVAHDLRGPLNVIAMSADELARRSAGSDDLGETELACIRRAVEALTRLASDLLDASCIDARGMNVECAPVDIVALIRDAIWHVPDRIERCEIHVEPDADVWVRADAGRVEQVLGNLLSNAAKYGDPDRTIDVDLVTSAGEVRVTVSNRGKGIPSDELSRIFDRFERTPDARKETQGHGLGLYIAKELIEAQGGRIWAQSIPGVITQFHFTLPLA